MPPTELDASQLPAVEAHLVEVATAGRPFPMRLSGTGTFRPLSPVVYVQVVEGAAACSWLQKQIRHASGPVARELHFPYHPHVTVAHGIDDALMDRAFEALADYRAEWSCTGFALYEQGADGVWRKLREFAFGEPSYRPRRPTPSAARSPATSRRSTTRGSPPKGSHRKASEQRPGQMPQRRHHHAQCPGHPDRLRTSAQAQFDGRGDGSGVVASRVSSRPAVIFDRTNPGRTTMTCTPVPCSASPSPWVKVSRPALLEP